MQQADRDIREPIELARRKSKRWLEDQAAPINLAHRLPTVTSRRVSTSRNDYNHRLHPWHGT